MENLKTRSSAPGFIRGFLTCAALVSFVANYQFCTGKIRYEIEDAQQAQAKPVEPEVAYGGDWYALAVGQAGKEAKREIARERKKP